MIGIVTGRVTKTGSSQYGAWCVVAETVTKRDGDQFEKRYMCSGNSVPAEGAAVIAQGFAIAEATERDGKHYADVKLNACSFTTLTESASAPSGNASASKPEEFADDIPFHHLPAERIEHTRCGHSRF